MDNQIIYFEDFLLVEDILDVEQFDKVSEYRKENRLNYIEIITKIFKYTSYERLIEEISKFYKLKIISFSSNSPILRIPDNFLDVDSEVANKVDINDVMNMETFPIKFKDGELTLVSTVPYLMEALLIYKEIFRPKKIKYVWTDKRVFDELVKKVYDEQIREKTLEGISPRPEEETAYSVFSRTQALVFGLMLLTVVYGLYLNALKTLVITNLFIQILYVSFIGYKLFLSFFGELDTSGENVKNELKNLNNGELPFYTILVPVYKEKEVIQQLLRGLSKLDYPKDRMEILILLEEDDKETIESVEKTLKNPALKEYNFIPIVVPNYQPKTKPKACNYGLIFSRGKYLVIYDAEDIPEPNQLKLSVSAFKIFPEKYICFQAHLNYYNTSQNFLTKMFTLEYSYWFDYMLPGLSKFNLPIPLGGTSNHFRTEKLFELGGWDPYNTTEDADLGMRAYLNGYKIGVIDSTTYEEANSKIGNWIRQRSRWIKGYMQTWLVYMREPTKLIKNSGFKGFLSFNMLVGGTSFIFLVNPILWLIFIYWLITRTELIRPLFPPEVYYIALINLTLGNFLAIYLNLLPIFKRRLYTLLPYAFLNPVYWILHSIAAYKALWQLFTKPYYWEKTQHGLSKANNLEENLKLEENLQKA